MWSEPVCYQARAAQTCLRQVGDQVCDLDSVMDFSKASLRPAHEPVRDPGRELDSVIEFCQIPLRYPASEPARELVR